MRLDEVREAVFLLKRAERLAVVFRRLFWMAAAGLGLTAVVVIGGNWEADPGWCLGLASVGQAWMAGIALWALRVYGRMEKSERAAQAASARAAVLNKYG